MPSRISLPTWLALAAALALTALAYLPGLHGGFLFDDFANLPALGASGPVDTWPTFWRYLTSGTADPTGRPLTLLSFLLDARDWPTDPFPFKRTNLCLHLLNGVLLYALLQRLARMLDIRPVRARAAAVLGAAFWLLHPLFVSTTLYIVQREAMLPATFALAGLLTWLHGRRRLLDGRIGIGLTWGLLGLGGFTVLGMLSKANGALLPVYAVLVEMVVCRRSDALHADGQDMVHAKGAAWHRRLMWVFGWAPAVALCGYLAWVGVAGIIHGGPAARPWTYAQRLLTEPRVLIDYLTLLWVPRASSTGLFNDQYLASRSLFQPLDTLLALLAVLALIVGALRIRRARPALALAVLFYFGGQLLESTSIPLELYFEHRNYVPALLMFWPLALWLTDLRTLKTLKTVLAIALVCLLALLTHARATVWGGAAEQAEIWARINPASPRAQANAAEIEIQTGHPSRAIERLTPLLAMQPDQVQLALNLIGARCATGGIGHADLVAAEQAMQRTRNSGSLLTHWFDRTLPTALERRCAGLDLDALTGLVDAGLRNPKLAHGGPRQDLLYMRGRVALAQNRPDEALAEFQRALDQRVRPGFALEAAAMLGSAGYPGQGLQMLDHYARVKHRAPRPGIGMPMLHAWVLARQDYWPHEFAHLRRQLSLDAAAAKANTRPSRQGQGRSG